MLQGLIFGGIGVLAVAALTVEMQRNVIMSKILGFCIRAVLKIFMWVLGNRNIWLVLDRGRCVLMQTLYSFVLRSITNFEIRENSALIIFIAK
jgi:hypothetical protein